MKYSTIKIVSFLIICCFLISDSSYADLPHPGKKQLISGIKDNCNTKSVLFSGICFFIILGLALKYTDIKKSEISRKRIPISKKVPDSLAKASFKISPAIGKNFALELNLTVNGSGNYSYSSRKENSDDIVELSKGRHNKEDGSYIKDLFFFERPEEGSVLRYTINASFETFPPHINFFKFEKKVTVYNFDNVFNIFVN